MTIPHWAIEREPVKSALERAERAVRRWLPYGNAEEREKVKAETLGGWSGWSMAEAIALEILEAQGYDLEEFDELDEYDEAPEDWSMRRIGEAKAPRTPREESIETVVATVRMILEEASTFRVDVGQPRRELTDAYGWDTFRQFEPGDHVVLTLEADR